MRTVAITAIVATFSTGSLAIVDRLHLTRVKEEHTETVRQIHSYYNAKLELIQTILTTEQQKIAPLLGDDTKVRRMTVTAYDAWSESSIDIPEYRDGITATGAKATPGRTVAVDPKVIPYGSRVFIPGMGWRVAEDTGGALKGDKIDVLMKDEETARQFGRKRLFIVWKTPKPNRG